MSARTSVFSTADASSRPALSIASPKKRCADHAHPTALICTPTLVSGALIALLIFLPALLLSNLWRASALTLGMLTGYLAYSCIHHAVHHWHGGGRWMLERKRCHAMHHHSDQAGHYGVTTSFWDTVFRTLK